ncbi:unnamed protein product [Adineta steineri]|uniref:Uncharacterized protein n=1 Tax=Adineta steineri TaxID=433720 RepID=A0A815II15_9BILA|nr:unnamed protein product [Adineta steineri]
MLLSTRDAQLERRCSRILASDALAERLTLAGIDNASFQGDINPEFRAPSIVSRIRSNSGIEPSPTPVPVTGEAPIKDAETAKTTTKKRYHWRMTHYFYIHISFFILNGFFCGLIIWLIENHSSSRNVQIDVPYVDAWFVATFGAVGLSLGYPNVASSFSSVLSPASKTILILTMLMGRHRGLLASMKDQEAIEHSAADLLQRKREEIIHEYEQRKSRVNITNEEDPEALFTRF